MSAFKGVAKARARARARPAILDRQTVAAISETVEAVHGAGRANIDAMLTRRSGILRRLYNKTVRASQKAGVVGYLTPRSRRLAFYARFLHDGTRHIIGRPFHDLAVAAQATPHRVRMLRALKSTLSMAGAPSRVGAGTGVTRGATRRDRESGRR